MSPLLRSLIVTPVPLMAATAGHGFTSQWILDVTDSTMVSAAGLQAAPVARSSPGGSVARASVGRQVVTADMNTNLRAGVEPASVPEPRAALPVAVTVVVGLAAGCRLRRR